MPTAPVKPEFGPSLPALLARLPRVAMWSLLAVAALLAVLLLAFVVARGDPETRVVVREPIAYNLKHPDALERVRPGPTESLRLEQRRADGLFLQSFAVRRVGPGIEGEPTAVLPLLADRIIERERRTPGVTLVREGRVRINEVPGYEFVTSVQVDGRRMWKRTVLLLEDRPGERAGVELVLLATPATGVPNAAAVGDQGALKLPLRSFRLGTEAP